MAEKQTLNQSNYGWYKSLEANGRYPIIAKRIYNTLVDAEGFLNDPTAIPGLIIRVVDDIEENNGAYIVQGTLGPQEQSPDLYLEKLATDSELEKKLEWLELSDEPKYVDLGLSVKWAKYLYGVNPDQLTAASDWYGKYLSWGELEEKAGWDGQGTKVPYDWINYKYANGANNKLTKYCNNSEYGNDGYTDNLITLETIDDVISVNYGGNWRIPTKIECEELIALPNQWINNYNPNKTIHNPEDDEGIQGLNGRVFTGNGNQLFIPAAGYRDGSAIYNAGSYCFLRSSSLNLTGPIFAYILSFYSGDTNIINNFDRCYGCSVCPVLDEN